MKPRFNVYLASRFNRRDELRGYRKQLLDTGIGVTSRWLIDENVIGDDHTPERLAHYGHMDIHDVMEAHAVVLFTLPESYGQARHGQGGKHIEFGCALGYGIPVLIVGPLENHFHHIVYSPENDSSRLWVWGEDETVPNTHHISWKGCKSTYNIMHVPIWEEAFNLLKETKNERP